MARISKSYDEEKNRHPVQDVIWASGVKATQPRMAVVKALVNERRPISAFNLQTKLSKVSVASVYRILEAFVDSGVVDRINTGRVHAMYEISSGRKHHHHVICTRCGDMEDVETGKDCSALKVQHLAVAHSGKFSSISKHSLEFFGLCKKCA